MSISSKVCGDGDFDASYFLQLFGISSFVIVSEILPFIKNVKSNGIIELLVNFFFSNKKTGYYEPIIQEEI